MSRPSSMRQTPEKGSCTARHLGVDDGPDLLRAACAEEWR
jgi:hypothetical protein